MSVRIKKILITSVCVTAIVAVAAAGCWFAYSATLPPKVDGISCLDRHGEATASYRVPLPAATTVSEFSSPRLSQTKLQTVSYSHSYAEGEDIYLDGDGNEYWFTSDGKLSSILYMERASEDASERVKNGESATKEQVIALCDSYLSALLPEVAEEYVLSYVWDERELFKDEYQGNTFRLAYSLPIGDWFGGNPLTITVDTLGNIRAVRMPSGDASDVPLGREERDKIGAQLPTLETVKAELVRQLDAQHGKDQYEIREDSSAPYALEDIAAYGVAVCEDGRALITANVSITLCKDGQELYAQLFPFEYAWDLT